MTSQAYTHHWDEIEDFKLAMSQADKDPKVAGMKAGGNGCHAPSAFFSGDVPPPLPSAGTVGSGPGIPFSPGRSKNGGRA